MDFFKNFFTSIYRSFYDIEWMGKNRDKMNQAWAYFFMFMLTIVIIQSIAVMWVVPRAIENGWNSARQQIPEFQAVVEDGMLALSGFEQPFVIEEYDNGEVFSIYVDTLTDEPLSVEDVFDDRVDTGLLITKDKLSAIEYGGLRTRGFSFREIEDMSFSGAQIIEKVDHFVDSMLPYMVPLLGIIMFIFWSAGKLLYLLIIAFIVWIISILGHKDWEFRQVYTVGLFAMTGPTVLVTALMWMGIGFSMLYTALLGLYLLFIIFLFEEKKAPAKKSRKKRSVKKKAPAKKK